MSDTDFEFGHNAPEPEAQPESACMGSVLCEYCGKRHGYCSEVESQIKGEQMLPRPDEDGSSTPARSKRAGSMRYLKNEDLSKTPKEAKIIGVKADPDNKFGAGVVLKMSLEGQTIFWTVRTKRNPNYRILTEKFGFDENDWNGNKILLFLEQDEFSDQFFPRVAFPTEKGSSARSGR